MPSAKIAVHLKINENVPAIGACPRMTKAELYENPQCLKSLLPAVSTIEA
jgi:hypothetical protein